MNTENGTKVTEGSDLVDQVYGENTSHEVVETKKARKSPTPVKVVCSLCGREAFSQSFRVEVISAPEGASGPMRKYTCRRKGGCTPSMTEQK